MNEDDLLEFQASLKILLEVLLGDQDRVSETCYDWKEALAAHLLWVDPTCKRDDLESVLKIVTQNWPTDPTNLCDRILSSILSNDPEEIITLSLTLDPWLSCHLSDLLSKLDPIENVQLRDFFVLDYIETLSVDQGLWRIILDYCDTVVDGKEWIRQFVRRLKVSDLDDTSKNVKNLGVGGVGLVELREVCEKFGIEEEVGRSAKIMASKMIKERKYGAAVAYAVVANDLKMISKISDLLLDEYVNQGPEEFARLVDEIPNSLLHPKAPTIRPGLFFDTNLPNSDTLSIGQHQHQQQPNLNSSRLVFLSRYRDMHSYYARGDKKSAAETLVGLLTSEIAPKQWWAVCLIDVIPLLEDEEMLIGLSETYELLRCLEAVIGDESYLGYLSKIVNGNDDDKMVSGEDQLGLVRYALSRNLARCLTCKY